MKVIFDDGNFIEDINKVLQDALNKKPSLIVVPTEKEVNTFKRHFGNCEGVECCSFSDYYNGIWLQMPVRPTHIFIFRCDDMVRNYAADAFVEYITVVSKKKVVKKEETNDEI